MPQLTYVHLEGYLVLGRPTAYAAPLSAAGLAGVVSCCPGLRRLDLINVPWVKGLRVTALQQLSALTQLSVAVADSGDVAAAMQDTATLTRLVNLYVEGFAAPSLWAAMLPCLAALRQLTRLEYAHHFELEGGWDYQCKVLTSKVGHRDSGPLCICAVHVPRVHCPVPVATATDAACLWYLTYNNKPGQGLSYLTHNQKQFHQLLGSSGV